jgi:hypothetical protein
VTLALAALFGVVFLEGLLLLDLRREVTQILVGSRDALAMLRSAASDDEKEAAMRRASLRMFAATGMLLLKFLAIAAALLLLYFLIVTVAPGRRAALDASFVSPLGIVVVTAAAFAYGWVRSVVVARL